MSIPLPARSISRRSALLGSLGLGAGALVPVLTPRTAHAYPSSQTSSFPTVREGSRGMTVRMVQALVHSTVDGVFGPNTATAVKKLQSAYGLVADGIVGAKSWAAFLNTVRQGDRNRRVVAVQVRLGITADGIFGSGTYSKVRSFQSAKGLSVDGVVGINTWGAMVGATGGSSGSNPKNLYTNGRMPSSALASVGYGSWRLSTYCVNDYKRMNSAFRSRFGKNLPISGSMSAYRTYDQQVYLWNLYQSGQGNKAAYPGTSNHGWGLAVDISVGGYGTTYFNWLNSNGPSYGFDNDVSGESWHWGYQR